MFIKKDSANNFAMDNADSATDRGCSPSVLVVQDLLLTIGVVTPETLPVRFDVRARMRPGRGALRLAFGTTPWNS